MGGKLREKLKTAFVRTMAFNLLMVLIATLLPQIVMLNSLFSLNRTKTIENSRGLLYQMQRGIDETILRKVVEIPTIYFSDLPGNAALTKGFYEDISGQSQAILQVAQEMNAIISIYDFIDSLHVYYSRGDILFTNGIITFLSDSSTRKTGRYKWMDTLKTVEADTAWFPGAIFSPDAGQNDIAYMRTMPYQTRVGARRGIVLLGIRRQALNQFLRGGKGEGETTFSIIDNQGRVIAGDEAFVLEEEQMTEICSQDEGNLLNAVIGGRQSIVYYMKSQYNDWRYVSCTSVEAFYLEYNRMRSLMIWLCAGLLLINIVVSVLISRTSFEPMRPLIRLIKSTAQFFNIWSGDKGEYLQLTDAMQALALNSKEMAERIEKSYPLIRQNAIRGLLTERTTVEEMAIGEGGYELSFRGDFCFAFVVITFPEGQAYEDGVLMQYGVADALEKPLAQADVKAVVTEAKWVEGVSSFYAGNENDVLQLMHAQVSALVSFPYTICVSTVYSLRGNNIAIAYREALAAAAYAYIWPERKSICYDLIADCDEKDSGAIPKLMKKTERFLRSRNDKELQITVDSIIETVIGSRFPISYCLHALAELVSVIRQTVIGMGYSEEEAFGCDIRNEYKRIRNVHEFRIWIGVHIDRIFQMMAAKRKDVTDGLEEKVLDYIQKNMYGDLSQAVVAASLFISPSYFSITFKAATGKGYTEYVTELKLKRAAELLQDNRLTVKKIAEMLGYHSNQYFARLFKEQFGRTPKEYRTQRY